MRRLRLLQLLLCVTLWVRLCDGATKDTCTCKDVEKLKGLYTDRPCNECASGHYRTCDRGSYYAHHPTMCIYASREDYTHEEAREMCVNRDVTGFPAFVGGVEESYDVSHYVWNSLKNGVEGNETYFWVGGEYKRHVRTSKTEGRTCLAGHTENYTKLYPRHCDEKLPAVCYNYRQTSKHFCEQVDGKLWTLFQGKCYYVYSSPTTDSRAGYKTFFDAQKECGRMGAIVATVTDEATFKRTLDLATGLETIFDIDDGTWIGLQLSGRGFGGIYYYTNGTTREFKKSRIPEEDEYPAQVRPLAHAEGWWEDGTPYNPTALRHFWAHMVQQIKYKGQWYPWEWDQPNEEQLKDLEIKDRFVEGKCKDFPKRIPQTGYNFERCQADKFEHCTQIFPGSTEDTPTCKCKAYGYKWNDRWCYFRQRGYICERDAVSVKDPYRRNDEL